MSLSEAEAAIGAVTLGLDMTRRDLQTKLKKLGHPWEVSKVFLDSAVTGPWKSVGEFPRYLDEKFSFHLDGELRQEGIGAKMQVSPAACVVHASQWFPLCAGDIVFTGSPAGVGPVAAGQVGELKWGELAYSVKWQNF